MMFSVLLKSGRGIRFAELNPAERDKVLLDAAKFIGPEATFMELRSVEHRLGIKAMIKGVTEQDGLADDDLLKSETKWKKLSPSDLDEKYDDWFTAKDHAVLSAIYRRYHEVDSNEMDLILGKAIPVVAG